MADTLRVVSGLLEGGGGAQTLPEEILVVCKKTLQNQVENMH